MTASEKRQPDQLPIRVGADGLIPAVIQEVGTDTVLMIGFMNAEALAKTRQTGRVHFWSRSRQALWRKGETSGHEQIVEEILVNCEQNSLLVRVRQLGAVCHDGYPTCFYRRLEPDNSLTVISDRAFDPVTVYSAGGRPASVPKEDLDLERLCRLQFGAYCFLKENDLASQSGTSARLRNTTAPLTARLADELEELAGTLDGSHRHRDLASDIVLEGSQVVYWATLVALRAGARWSRLRTDRALVTGEADLPAETTAALLRAEGRAWRDRSSAPADIIASVQATLALVGQACASTGVAPRRLVEHDLAELRSKAYLSPYFARASAEGTID